MDNVRSRGSYSPIKRSYYTKPAFRPKDLKQDVKTFGVQNMTTAGTRAVVNTGKGKMDTDLKKLRWVWRPKGNYLDHVSKDSGSSMLKKGNPEILLQDHAVVDSGCSSHMIGNKAYLSNYKDYNGGFVAFGSDPKGDELKFNLFSVSQMCDKKNSVLFTETECLILSPSFKLLDKSQVVLRAPRKDDVYSFLWRSAEGSMQQHDLTVLVNKLNDRIDELDKDLQQTKKIYSTALTKLVLRGKKISQIDEDLTISLVQDEGISWIPQEEEVHEKPSDETKVIIQEETPTEIIEEHGSGEKGEIKISTASPLKVTKVSIAEAHVYTRRKAKDKGKAIMEEPATPKKLKKRTQVQLSMDEELARKIEEEEERARFNAEQEARALQKEEEEERLNLEAAWELQKQLDERQQVPTEATQSKGIDWNDPSVLKYHALKNKHVSIAQARNILEEPRRVWDHVNTFIPMGSEVEKGSSKPSKRETSKAAEEENVEKEDVKPDPVMSEKKSVGTRRKTLARRRASDKQVEDRSKRQKKEKESDDVEQEKEDLRIYPIVNWEYQLPGRMEITDIEVYKLTRADGSASFHGGTKSLFRRLDRDDLKVLYKLVQERFKDHSLEEKELILWGDLRMMFDPDKQDEIWKNQESWKVLRWRLYENSGVHSVFLIDTPMEINMLVEKKFPLKKEILEKMINLKLQAEEESTMAFELIKFTRSQIEEKQ
ncbi:hypothetical protein Tco_0227566 [Tanacetum coccineum]